MRIIIDGNDGVGKTTLAKKLQKEFKLKSYIHLSYKDPRNFKFYNQVFKKEGVIFDRSFIDEPIYSKVLGRKNNLSKNDLVRLYRQIYKLNYIVIICLTERNKFGKNEHIQIKQNKDEIDAYFKDIAREYGYILFDPINGDYNLLLHIINQRIKK